MKHAAHVSETVLVPHHGQVGGFHCPARVYLLRSPSAAMRGKMGITCALSASKMAKHCKKSWVLVTLQRLAHTTPYVRTPHICLHNAPTCSKKAHPQEVHPPHIHYQDGRWRQRATGPLHQRKSHPSQCFHQSTQPT